MKHLTMDELEAGLEEIESAPKSNGTVEMIVARPTVNGRLTLQKAALTINGGLEGDNWAARKRVRPDEQITIANVRVVRLYAQKPERWPLAGDQLYVDFDISNANLKAGDRIRIGTAVLQITSKPHDGCNKFIQRFGHPAFTFVNMDAHRHLNLRGIYAIVVQSGTIHAGDGIIKV